MPRRGAVGRAGQDQPRLDQGHPREPDVAAQQRGKAHVHAKFTRAQKVASRAPGHTQFPDGERRTGQHLQLDIPLDDDLSPGCRGKLCGDIGSIGGPVYERGPDEDGGHPSDHESEDRIDERLQSAALLRTERRGGDGTARAALRGPPRALSYRMTAISANAAGRAGKAASMGDIIDLETQRRRRAERQRRRSENESERSRRRRPGADSGGTDESGDTDRDRDPERSPSG
mgnify:CR=1 FL=1